MKFGKYNISPLLILWWLMKFNLYKFLKIDRNVKYPSPKWCNYPDTFDNINYCWGYACYIDDIIQGRKKRNDNKFKKNCETCEFYKGGVK